MRALPIPASHAVIVGLESPDDAAVVRMSDDMAIVVTTDFFTPIVDDPRDFGRIAACNALSDIYAMGAIPLVALNIAAFPSKTLPMSILGEILLGGAEIAAQAGIVIAGGHTIDDAEPKYGLAVVGTVHPDKVWRKGGARAGDALVLTKGLGTGILSTALKRDLLAESHEHAREMVRSMTTLNARAAEIIRTRKTTVHAATDVTGYGLAGHLLEMIRASEGVTAELIAANIRALPGAYELARDGVLPGGTRANRDHVGDDLSVSEGVDPALMWLASDAQTSGGLLVSVPAEESQALVTALRDEAGLSYACVVGYVHAQSSSDSPRIVLR